MSLFWSRLRVKTRGDGRPLTPRGRYGRNLGDTLSNPSRLRGSALITRRFWRISRSQLPSASYTQLLLTKAAPEPGRSPVEGREAMLKRSENYLARAGIVFRGRQDYAASPSAANC